jgi:hypothetical protein
MTIFYYKGEQKRQCNSCQVWIDEIPEPVDYTAFGDGVLDVVNLCADCTHEKRFGDLK